jgi:quinol monooxygenase YgiN
MADDMVIVAGTFTVEAAQRAEFLEGRRESILASREDRGCIEYAMSADATDPAVVRLFEMWSSMADLQAHVQRIRFSAQAESGVTVLARVMKIYVGAKEEAFGA